MNIKSRHEWRSGNPAGGVTEGPGLEVHWQDGPIGEGCEQSGAQVEDVIDAAIDRLLFFQQSKFACNENVAAITDLHDARHHLMARTRAREARGVEGTYEP